MLALRPEASSPLVATPKLKEAPNPLLCPHMAASPGRCGGFAHPARQETGCSHQRQPLSWLGFLNVVEVRWKGGGGRSKALTTLNPQAGQGSSQPSEGPGGWLDGQGHQPPMSVWQGLEQGPHRRLVPKYSPGAPAHWGPEPRSMPRAKLSAETQKGRRRRRLRKAGQGAVAVPARLRSLQGLPRPLRQRLLWLLCDQQVSAEKAMTQD